MQRSSTKRSKPECSGLSTEFVGLSNATKCSRACWYCTTLDEYSADKFLTRSMNGKQDKIVAKTGDKCITPGLYWAMGCNHPNYREMKVNEVFPICQTCHKSILWFHDKSVTG